MYYLNLSSFGIVCQISDVCELSAVPKSDWTSKHLRRFHLSNCLKPKVVKLCVSQKVGRHKSIHIIRPLIYPSDIYWSSLTKSKFYRIVQNLNIAVSLFPPPLITLEPFRFMLLEGDHRAKADSIVHMAKLAPLPATVRCCLRIDASVSLSHWD